MKIYAACECRYGTEHYYGGCHRRATFRVKYPVFFGLFKVSKMVCEPCSSIYSRRKCEITDLSLIFVEGAPCNRCGLTDGCGCDPERCDGLN